MILCCRGNCKVTYLRRNVKTLNEPVNYVPSNDEAEHWWPNKVPSLARPAPPKTLDSTMRGDYQWGNEHDQYQGNRHKHNFSKPAHGTSKFIVRISMGREMLSSSPGHAELPL